MNVEDMILVSIDDHVIEPRDMFERHVPDEVAGPGAPQCAERRGHRAAGTSRGSRRGSMGLNAVVSWPKYDWGMDPTTFAEMRPGAYDVDERIRDMDRNGILASMCFPIVRRLQRRLLPAGNRQRPRARDAPGLQRLAHRRVVRCVSRAVHSAGDRARCGIPRRLSDEIRRVAAKGCHRDHDARAPAHPGTPELPQPRVLGSVLPGRLRRAGRDVPAHRPGLRGDQRRARSRRSTT